MTAYQQEDYLITIWRKVAGEAEEQISLEELFSLTRRFLHAPIGRIQYGVLTEEVRSIS